MNKLDYLKDLDNTYTNYFEKSTEALLLLKEERFVSVNSNALKLLKVRNENALLDIHPIDISPEIQPDGLSSEEKAKQIFRLVEQTGSHKFDWVHRPFDGLEVPVEVSLTKINLAGDDVIQVSLRSTNDIHERQHRVDIGNFVYSQSNDAIMVADEHTTIIDVNPAFEEITGYSRSEAVGKKTGFMKSGVHNNEFYQNMWLSLRREGEWEGEVWDRTKDGKVYPKELKIKAIKGPTGKVVNYVAIFSDSSDKIKHQKELERLAYYDALTGLPNRSLLLKKLELMVNGQGKKHSQFNIAFVDIDKFKIINDTKGHHFGDEILKTVSKELLKVTKHKATCGRMSGDEFLIIFNPNVSSFDVNATIKSLMHTFESPVVIEGLEYYVSLSVGLNNCESDATDIKALVAGADVAMYHAKQSIGNQCFWYNHDIGKSFNENHELELDLIGAIKSKAIFPHFQPIIDLNSGKIAGCESLARWQRASGEYVSPAKFIPIAERLSRFSDLSNNLLQTSFAVLTGEHVDKSLTLSVNVSAKEIGDKHYFDQFNHILKQFNVDPTRLQIEITETCLIENLSDAKSIIEKFRRLGVKVALDDFGAGFSSLTYLHNLDLNTLKLDKSLADNLANKKNRVIVSSIIDMAHKLGIKVVAEGVEEACQVAVLKELKCDYIQGYYYHKPMPFDAFNKLL